jgi:hypothetical protein
LKLRLAIFACLLLAFWGGIAFFIEWEARLASPEDREGFFAVVPGMAIAAGLFILMWIGLRKLVKADRMKHHARKRAKRMRHLLETTVKKK